MREYETGLIPCPFCGSLKLISECCGSAYSVNCCNCGAIGSHVGDGEDAIEDAHMAWNKRDSKPLSCKNCKFWDGADDDTDQMRCNGLFNFGGVYDMSPDDDAQPYTFPDFFCAMFKERI